MWKARVAVFGIFVLNGIIIGAWSARVPAIARQAHASPGALGLAMLGASIGLVIAASLAGRLCAVFGARSVVIGGGVLCCVALPVLGTVTSVVLLGLALSALTFGIGLGSIPVRSAKMSFRRSRERTSRTCSTGSSSHCTSAVAPAQVVR